MKKATLTIGLFSLIMVATSFANPVVTNASSTKNMAMAIDPGLGQAGRDGRKLDVQGASNQLNTAGTNLSSFSSASQSARSTVKVD
ncbi:hypothetical protein [Flavobacterium sp. LC2016-12]|uniref:hypothetical protein n=1 Tax=Flavobacterium sp. LC2016-12 TaxID=2783794 RepID=UPI00188BB3F1|nr:hypothetical protein [Flavobacterium sp. LC2016-12]MBF4466082.1 hypothetical protein [Flavobacterium sp. LC2016-12]